MPKVKSKTSKKPIVLNSAPSANWKMFMSSKPTVPQEKKIDVVQKVMSIEEALEDFTDKSSRFHSHYSSSTTKVYGIDCEMVGVASSQKDMLARVSIVDMHGILVYDKFVNPTETVTDYRTWVSGIRPRNLKNGEPYDVVRQEVSEILQNNIVVGHSVGNDFRVLQLKHPKHLIRDTSLFPVFREMFSNRTPSLRNLARVVLGVNIQSGEHSSVQDARATVQLYMVYRNEWEEHVFKKRLRAPSKSSFKQA